MFEYFLFWPGLNAVAFCTRKFSRTPSGREWLLAVSKIVFGITLLWVLVPRLSIDYPLLRGWVGMIGLVLLLHFGVFDLLSLYWGTRGIEAKPLMNSPLTATSLSEFWGARWNTAFNDLMRRHVFVDLSAPLGPRTSLLVVFLISGLIHDAVISFPARGGYGLPTAYFILQAFGLLFERSRGGSRLGLGHGPRGWVFVLLIAGLPAYWLFHPVFIRNVILPMLKALGAI